MHKTDFRKILIMLIANVALSVIAGIVILLVNQTFDIASLLRWVLFVFIVLLLVSIVLFSNKVFGGKLQEILFFMSCDALISMNIAYIIFALAISGFKFSNVDWFGAISQIIGFDSKFLGLTALLFLLVGCFYFFLFDRDVFELVRSWFRDGLRGSGKMGTIEANLENSRWMTDAEIKKTFKTYNLQTLGESKKDGIPIMARLTNNDRDLKVVFNSPCHSIIIGSTGSGKTTTFVNPMIQVLARSSAGSSMVITDPKGELFAMHSGYLVERGYQVRVIDLRDTYQSYHWNPLDGIWDKYQQYAQAENNAFSRTDSAKDSGLTLSGNPDDYGDEWYEFDGKGYPTYEKLIVAIKLYKKKIYDEVYEDLNDLASILVPVENDKDPMWEKGARAITLATLLAMLEDSEDERLHMTKEKYNFFNLTKILQNSSNDYIELRRYFAGRSPISKALSLSKQVCDAAESTRASYMSIVYEKLSTFNDSGICALTSKSDFMPADLADGPTALFLKIPDEKTTRYNLAAIFIVDLYKSLIAVASKNEDLSLPRNVYFILDEFGNMPKISNLDKMITVGRSRKIWFNMIIQSYSQLNNVYDDKAADIIKGNCGIKMFIGSNDIGTCKEYSELCGNITVVTRSTSSSDHSRDVNTSMQTQVRPLIYPSDLQRLNKPGDIGHSVIVTFGNFPLKTYFTPSFKVPFYKIGKMDTSELDEQLFDENEMLYDVTVRNGIVFSEDKSNAQGSQSAGGGMDIDIEDPSVEQPAPEEVLSEDIEKIDEMAQEEIEEFVKELKTKYPKLKISEIKKVLDKQIAKSN